MIQDIGIGRFRNEYFAAEPEENSRVLCYRGREILAEICGSTVSYLTYRQVTERFPELKGRETYLFAIDGVRFFLFRDEAGEQLRTYAQEAFPLFRWYAIERLRGAKTKEASFAGVTGLQLSSWYAARRFCPRCGQALVHDEKERMMRCRSCGLMEYPKISPAVIVAVTDKDKLLLTKYAGRAYAKYALIAGFAEIGETIEETVRREVMEEVGLKIKNLRYYKSQPWSFSDTLLMGFFADVDGKQEIRLDRNELSVAEWCERSEIPDDDGVSLTREMMRLFADGQEPQGVK